MVKKRCTEVLNEDFKNKLERKQKKNERTVGLQVVANQHDNTQEKKRSGLQKRLKNEKNGMMESNE